MNHQTHEQRRIELQAIEHHVKALKALGWEFRGRGLYPKWRPFHLTTTSLRD